MNPVFKIIAKQTLNLGLPATLAWIAWKRFAKEPLKPSATEISACGLVMCAYFASLFDGPQSLWYPRLMTSLPRSDRLKKVALTFDDGPDPVTTPIILDALRDSGSRATFFVLLEPAIKHPELIQRMAREGHTIGIHGATHEPAALWSVRQIVNSIRMVKREIGEAVCPPRFFRPPYGFKSPNVQKACDRLGMTLVTWSLNPKDYMNLPQGELFNRVALRATSGDIVVLHDTLPSTAEALPAIIKKIQGRGLKLVRL